METFNAIIAFIVFITTIVSMGVFFIISVISFAAGNRDLLCFFGLGMGFGSIATICIEYLMQNYLEKDK